MEAIDIVRKARDVNRLKAMDYIEYLCEPFVELHGDRLFSDDEVIVAGIGMIEEYSVMIIGHQKDRNFGMAKPEGYRKVLRLIEYAQKHKMPVITLIDTPGADCGIEAEQRGQSSAIANCICNFSQLKIPTLSIVIGEAGSGGALALGVTDEIWMLENGVYSILSPEGFASILWRDTNRKDEAAKLMRLTSKELMEDGFVDKIIKEDGGELYHLKNEVLKFLEKNYLLSTDKILKKRHNKYRKILGG
ncbi:acetyl-CoA carboxylase subunit alpha [Peptostreptococcus russellii]|uniref:acetyl-CoA carboxytransferase n=1 Tax=Peptostreptococcus russellii TaxID=215200 RepID=A0A2P7Q242_9FIRM|nr:carboxyl transferase domain-containing protein [Peptostreptococcus russellii]PSJ32029.1 acetyl-CoA carboxylase subunit alpha [Peptostreptococcus russellii]